MSLTPKELGVFVKKFIDKYSVVLGPDFHHVTYNYTINYQSTKIAFTSNDTKVTFSISNSKGLPHVDLDIESLDDHYIEQDFVNSILNIEKVDYSMIYNLVNSIVSNDEQYIQSIESHSISEHFVSSKHVTILSLKHITKIAYVPVFFKILQAKKMSFNIEHSLRLDDDLNFYFDFIVYINHKGKSINRIDVHTKDNFYSRQKQFGDTLQYMTYNTASLVDDIFNERCESIKEKVNKKINMNFEFEFGANFKEDLKVIEMLLI